MTDYNKINIELENLLTLLKQEREEDLIQYQNKIRDTSVIARREEGVCWYPVIPENTSYDAGERLLIKVNRHPEHEKSHSFRSGSLVNIFTNNGKQGGTDEIINGVVNYVKKNTMLITLEKDDIEDELNARNLGVQLMFDDNSYREMESAVRTLIVTDNKRLIDLKNILYGNKEASFSKLHEINIPSLNKSQNEALNLINSAQDLAIVHGPPGTGKTTTLVKTILHTLKHENRILVSAASNAAVDLLAEKLNENQINVVRIGHPARVNETSLMLTLDSRITKHPNYKELKNLRKDTEEYFAQAKKYKRNFGYAEREQRREILKYARDLKKDASQLEYYIIKDIIENAQVIACTLVGSNNQTLRDLRFKTVFIDEAAQALEPASWIPILKADRVIFAGDHFQLPPTVKSYDAAKAGLEVTLFEKVIKNTNADVMLNEQYRMNTEIMNFSARYFYNEELIANESVENRRIFEGDLAVEFIDTAGCGFEEQTDPETLSTLNKEEANLLIKHFQKYIENVDYNGKIYNIQNIGIISPYNAQVSLLKELFSDCETNEYIKNVTSVNTIDSFQGQERDIIYISLVRSNEKGVIGFLSDVRRMNVAMTRAKKKLVIIGDSSTIGRHKFYDSFLNYVNEISAYRSAYEFLY